MFVGRKKELTALNNKYNSEKKEFGVIYGRRRIGKTRLIEEFLEDKESLYFQAKKDSIYGNLRSFSYLIDKKLGLPKNFVFSSFEEAFDSIFEYAGKRRFVIAIDEYPYIVSQDKSFPSLLQSIVDKASDNFFFLISGSDVSMLKNELENHNSPLYKRRTFEMQILKLPFLESLEYLKDVPNEEKVKYLSLTGTYPYYLSAIDFSLSFEENVRKLLFDEYGAFFTLPDQLLSNSTSTQDIYNAILTAVANRRRSISDISSYIHEEPAKVSKYIKTLTDSELLEKRETYMGNKKTNYYEISDPLLRFWYAFIFDNAERIKKNGAIVFSSLKEDIEAWVSYGFEEVALLYMNDLNDRGLLSDIFPTFKNYKVENSKLKRSIEIDGLSNNETDLIVVECKYRKKKFSKEMYDHLVESVSVFPDKYQRSYYLFSKNGFDEELTKLPDPSLHLIGLDDIFHS